MLKFTQILKILIFFILFFFNFFKNQIFTINTVSKIAYFLSVIIQRLVNGFLANSYYVMFYTCIDFVNLLNTIFNDLLRLLNYIKNLFVYFLIFNVIFFILKKYQILKFYSFLFYLLNNENFKFFIFNLICILLSFYIIKELYRFIKFIPVLIFFNLQNIILCSETIGIRQLINNIHRCLNDAHYSNDVLLQTKLIEISNFTIFTLNRHLALIHIISPMHLMFDILFLSTEQVLDINFLHKGYYVNYTNDFICEINHFKHSTLWKFDEVYIYELKRFNCTYITSHPDCFKFSKFLNIMLDIPNLTKLTHFTFDNFQNIEINSLKLTYHPLTNLVGTLSKDSQHHVIPDIESHPYAFNHKYPKSGVFDSKSFLIFIFCNILAIECYVKYNE